ncbi:MAG: hypothetical protein E6I87_08225 [Chloroflexi bacterium]|nr:MAG: hypothetical protein E6I87_08225 [Chloroflexota bacterium]
MLATLGLDVAVLMSMDGLVVVVLVAVVGRAVLECPADLPAAMVVRHVIVIVRVCHGRMVVLVFGVADHSLFDCCVHVSISFP